MTKFEYMDKEFEEMKSRWYKEDNVMFNIIDNMKYREGAFLRKGVVHRCIKANKIDFLIKHYFPRYHFLDEPFNLYYSLSHYPNLPVMSFGKEKRREDMNDFNKVYQDFIKGYDFLIDIDNPDLRLAYSTAFRVKQIFDKYKVPASYMFSGNKGFHIRVKYDDFPQELKDTDFSSLANKFKLFAEKFKQKHGFQDIDTTIFDLRRIAKCPYSVVYPLYLIALPLSDKDFNNFSLAKVSLPYWLENMDKLYRRGIMTREGEPEGFKRLIDDTLGGEKI